MIELSHAEDLLVDRELCKRSLSDFVKLAWHVIEPTQEYVHGWHIDAICEHLQAVSDGKITRLLINCPPGVMKSLLVGVFWPMWEWGPRGQPSLRTIGSSYSQSLALRDNLRARRIVYSEWFQERWPLMLTADQDAKTKFENAASGWRAAMSSGSMTGERGDRVIIDDPHSVQGAISDQERESTLTWFKESVPTRLNNPKSSAIVVIMQRLHDRDVSGFIIKEELGYEHLMLPMRFEKERHCKTNIGFSDPRTEDGELLFPERFPLDVVERDEKVMGGRGGAAVAGQFQQRPSPRGGLMIPAHKMLIGTPPVNIIRRVRYWDKAGTEGGGARTAGVLMGITPENQIWILHVVKGQWGSINREKAIMQTAILDGESVRIWVEQEPGSGGLESAEATIRMLVGYSTQKERPTGDKVLRAEPFATQVDAGNVFLARGAWNSEYIEECGSFPLGQFKDQVDATSGAFSKVTKKQSITIVKGVRV